MNSDTKVLFCVFGLSKFCYNLRVRIQNIGKLVIISAAATVGLIQSTIVIKTSLAHGVNENNLMRIIHNGDFPTGKHTHCPEPQIIGRRGKLQNLLNIRGFRRQYAGSIQNPAAICLKIPE